MKFTLNQDAAHTIATPCLVIAIFAPGADEAPLPSAARTVDEAADGRLGALIVSGDVATGVGKTTLLHGLPGVAAERILVVGCGKSDKFDRARFDRVCYAAGTRLRNHPVTEAHACLNELEVEALDAGWRTRHAALALDRANYRYVTTKPRKEDDNDPMKAISLAGGDELEAALSQARGLAAGYRRARQLGDLPPNICNPGYLATTAREIAGRHDKASIEVLDRKAMADLGMDALLAVAQGSEFDPHLVVLRHQGAGEDDAPVVLVGKGITFDTGGISIKPRENMDQMKYDMGGAAAVIGAFEACATLDLPINLVCIVGAVENMPDGRAYRPGDVITSMSGQTIEVLNTDAEGRMVLCDALTYAERFEPRALIDVATLTGACVVALGHHASGLMTHHDDLAEELVAAGQNAVDRAWRLPLWEEYDKQLESNFADMKNIGGMPAGSVTAGCFLARFTGKQRWAHLDVAGSAWIWGKTEGATGRPLGLLVHYLMDQASNG